MATTAIEERVTVLETELAEIKRQLNCMKPEPVIPWYDKIAGTFANSEGFEEAMRLGREYRESLRPKDDEDAN